MGRLSKRQIASRSLKEKCIEKYGVSQGTMGANSLSSKRIETQLNQSSAASGYIWQAKDDESMSSLLERTIRNLKKNKDSENESSDDGEENNSFENEPSDVEDENEDSENESSDVEGENNVDEGNENEQENSGSSSFCDIFENLAISNNDQVICPDDEIRALRKQNRKLTKQLGKAKKGQDKYRKQVERLKKQSLDTTAIQKLLMNRLKPNNYCYR